MTDIEILDALQEIKEIGGANDKEEKIKYFKEVVEFKTVLKYLYDTNIVFGLSTKKINKKINNVELAKDCNTMLEVFEYLETNNTGTDFDIRVVQNYMSKMDEKYTDTLKEMFAKKFKIGVTEKTLAKIFPNMFVSYTVMSGIAYEKGYNDLETNIPDIILTQKLDGMRCTARVENGDVKMYARSGKLIEGLNEIVEELAKLPNGAYDGELLKMVSGTIIDISKQPSKSICHKLYCPKNAEELYSETMSIVGSKEPNKTGIIFFVFDMIDLENFDTQTTYDVPASIRKAKLETLMLTQNSFFIKYVPVLYEGQYNSNIVDGMLNVAVTLEQEGLMLNYADAPYEYKKTSTLLKIKQFYTADVKIQGFEEGTGKNKGKLGAYLIKTPQGVDVKVGIGITDEEREMVWGNQDEYLGKIIEIAFTTPSTNKDDEKYNLRFPRFKRFRNDKSEENWEIFDDLISKLGAKNG